MPIGQNPNLGAIVQQQPQQAQAPMPVAAAPQQQQVLQQNQMQHQAQNQNRALAMQQRQIAEGPAWTGAPVAAAGVGGNGTAVVEPQQPFSGEMFGENGWIGNMQNRIGEIAGGHYQNQFGVNPGEVPTYAPNAPSMPINQPGSNPAPSMMQFGMQGQNMMQQPNYGGQLYGYNY